MKFQTMIKQNEEGLIARNREITYHLDFQDLEYIRKCIEKSSIDVLDSPQTLFSLYKKITNIMNLYIKMM